jgi:hypothetical protein
MTGPQRTVEYYGPGEVPIYKPTAYSKGWLNMVPGVNHGILLESEPFMEGADFGSHSWIQWRTVSLANELQLALLKKKTVKQALTDASKAINQVLSTK